MTNNNGGGWTTFLNSLATSGGNLFLLAFFTLVIMFIIIPIMIYFGPSSPSVITLTGAFSAFTGAMIGILRGSRIDTPPNTTVTQDTHTSTIPPVEEAPKQ